MIKKIVSVFLVSSLILSLFTPIYADTNFSDMPNSSYWSYEALKKAVENGLIQGYNGKLNPKSHLTRAELATILNNAFGAVEWVDTSSLKDVPSDSWYAKEGSSLNYVGKSIFG